MTIQDKVQQAIGSAKEKLGEATGNRRLRASGRAQRRTAQIREVARNVRAKANGLLRETQVRRRSTRVGHPS